MVHNVVGQIARDDDFFDREPYLERLRHEGLRDHILLLAPRRVGKTSLLYRFATVLEREEGMHAVYVSVQGAVDELDVLRKLHDACAAHTAAKGIFAQRAKRGLRGLLGRVNEVSLAGFGVKLDQTELARWQEPARELLAALEHLPGHWFYLVDELPVFVLRMLREAPDGARARAFLEWFRSVRQAPLRDAITRHWVLAGSIGLDTVAHRHRLSDTINDLRPLRLGAFDRQTALDFLGSLGHDEDVPISAEVARRIVERSGWPIPYHLQAVFAQLKETYGDSGREPDVAEVDRAFDSLLSQHKYFDSWHERLTDELGAVDAALARKILAACARDASGAARATLDAILEQDVHDEAERDRQLRYLLDVLTNDGYLHDHDGRIAFRSELLREFWVRRYA